LSSENNNPSHPASTNFTRMKLKCHPEDFCVDEIAGSLPEGGDYAFYHLTKRGLGTPEAIEAIRRRWNIPPRWIAFGGLKDRHAVTTQWITIGRGPRRDLHQTNLTLKYRGQVGRALASSDILANRFRIVARDLGGKSASLAQEALDEASRDGLPNYFDEQRFGSLGESGEFIAQAWCRGDYERAVWLAVAEPHPHDRSQTKAVRKAIRDHWGDWSGCLASSRRSELREIVAYLAARPADFRGAIAKVRQDLRSIYLAAFQSFLWNALLAEFLRESMDPSALAEVDLAGQTAVFYRHASPEQFGRLRETEIPLPSARVAASAGSWRPLIDRVLTPLGLTLPELRVKHPRESFFSKGDRRAVFVPEAVSHRIEPDDLHDGRRKLSVEFQLPRGSYATIVLKRLFLK
jgi:tRNA pseudouridine13 synthase